MQRMRQLDLSQTLETSRHILAAAARAVGAPQWCSQLTKINSHAGNGGGGVGSGGGRGHRGFLFELFELREGAYDHHFRALASLLCKLGDAWGRSGARGGGVAETCSCTAMARSRSS